jgi:hypothetical protein
MQLPLCFDLDRYYLVVEYKIEHKIYASSKNGLLSGVGSRGVPRLCIVAAPGKRHTWKTPVVSYKGSLVAISYTSIRLVKHTTRTQATNKWV